MIHENIIFSMASRGSASAQVYRHLSFVLLTSTEHLTEKYSKSSPNQSKNGAESMNKRPWNDGGAETRFLGGGRKPWNPRGWFGGSIVGHNIAKRMWKTQSTNHIENEYPETRALMPKGFQKEDKFDAQTHPKSMTKYVSSNILKIIKDQIFLNHKNHSTSL